jgi:DNA-binding IclR family transcriptional regulator
MEASLSAVERERLLGSPEFGEAALAAKRDGYALSRHEVVEGVMGVAVPLRIPGEPPAAVAVVHFSLPESLDDIVGALQGAAREIAQNYA